MHRTPCARCHIHRRPRTRRSTARSTRPRPLEDRASTLHSTRRRWRCGIDRTRPSLRHDHATCRRSRRRCWRSNNRFLRRRRGGRLRRSGRNRSGRSRRCRSSRCRSGSRRSRRSSRRNRSSRLNRRSRCRSRSNRSSRNDGLGGYNSGVRSDGHSRRDGRCRSSNHRSSSHHTLCRRGNSAANRRTSHHRPGWRTACNRRCPRRRSRSHNARALAGQRHNAAWCGGSRRCRRSSRDRCRRPHSRSHWSTRCRSRSRGWCCRHRLTGTRCNHGHRRPLWRSILRRRLCTLPLENRAQRIAGLRDVGQIELGLCLGCGAVAAATAAVLEVIAYSLGLVSVDGTGVRLSGHANRFQRIQNRLALYF